MTLEDYLKFLDWSGCQFRTDKNGVIPAACAPILDRLDCSEEAWFDLVKNFRLTQKWRGSATYREADAPPRRRNLLMPSAADALK